MTDLAARSLNIIQNEALPGIFEYNIAQRLIMMFNCMNISLQSWYKCREGPKSDSREGKAAGHE